MWKLRNLADDSDAVWTLRNIADDSDAVWMLCGRCATFPMTQYGCQPTLPNVDNGPDAMRTLSNVVDEDAMLIAQSVTKVALSVKVGSLETVSRS